MRIYIGGVQGVGKSTIVNQFKIRHPEFFCASSSELLMDIYKVSSRKELSGIEIPDDIFKDIYKKNRFCLIDGHFYLPKFDIDNIDMFIFINAPLDIILSRRGKDISRVRPLDKILLIKDYKDTLERACKIGKKVFVLENIGDIKNVLYALEKNICSFISEGKTELKTVNTLMNELLTYGFNPKKETGIFYK